MPHQFFGKICDGLKGKVLPYARGISCIKGVEVSAERGCELFSNTIAEKLGDAELFAEQLAELVADLPEEDDEYN